jgi:hypothetical protein
MTIRSRQRLIDVLRSVNREALRIGNAMTEAERSVVYGTCQRAADALEGGEDRASADIKHLIDHNIIASPHIRELLEQAAAHLRKGAK